MLPPVPAGWTAALSAETKGPSFQQLEAFLKNERQTQTVFPAEADTFAALALTPLDEVRVLILGQDPYPGEGQAHGLSFSVPPGVKLPASLARGSAPRAQSSGEALRRRVMKPATRSQRPLARASCR